MFIGIGGKNDKERIELSKYIVQTYNYMYIDVDNLLADEFNKINEIAFDTIELNLINRLNLLILDYIHKVGEDKNIIFSTSLLEKTILPNICNYMIKTTSRQIFNPNDKFDMVKKFISNSIPDYFNEYMYQFKIELKGQWKNKIDHFFEFNINNNNKISIIVPIYNSEEYLIQCVNSLRNQSYRNIEIILIDDGSNDSSLQLCEMLASIDNRIKVYHQENHGLSSARNKGIELATGDYIGFVDSDDFVENDMYENLIKNIKKYNTDVSAVRAFIHTRKGNVEKFSNNPREIVCIKSSNLITSYCDGIVSIAVWDKIFKKEALKGIRFREDVFQEDSDFILQLCLAGKSFVCDTKEFYHYMKRDEGSLTGTKFSKKLFQLQDWGKESYQKILDNGIEYQDDAEKCLFNSLSHILKTNIRDLKNQRLTDEKYREKIQSVANDLLILLLNAKNVTKFDDLENTLNVVNELISMGILNKDRMPTIDIHCIGIIWNTLNDEQKKKAIEMISHYSQIKECISTDLKDQYKNFIYDIYYYNNEFEGIPYFKSCAIIDKYDTNNIIILNLIVKVSNLIFYNNLKGYLFKEISDLKQLIRKEFKSQIKNYGYDTIFHLTVNDDEYKYTDAICKKYIKKYRGVNGNGK